MIIGCEPYRPKPGPQGDSILKPDGVRVEFVNEVRREPRKSCAEDAKSMFKTLKKYVVIDHIEKPLRDQKSKGRDITLVSGRLLFIFRRVVLLEWLRRYGD